MNGWRTRQHGTTLVELTIAVAIMATVFTAVLPLFAGIRNSTEARWAGLEMVQNARVLNEYLSRHLAEARRVTDVSGATDDRGYIVFETAAGSLCRCCLGEGGAIEFGPADGRQGRESPGPTRSPAGVLAGPARYLRFICYDGNDLAHPTTTAGRIRLVTWEAGWRSSSRLTRGRVVSGSCYLRVDTRAGDPPTATTSDRTERPSERITPLSFESPSRCVPGRQKKPAPGSGCRAYACVSMPGPRREHGYASAAMAPGLPLSSRPEAKGRSGEIWPRTNAAPDSGPDVSTSLDMTNPDPKGVPSPLGALPGLPVFGVGRDHTVVEGTL